MSRLPNVTPRKVVAALKRAGFIEHHQTGSHLYLWRDETRTMTCVPMHSRDVKRPTLKSIVKQAELSEEAFRELL